MSDKLKAQEILNDYKRVAEEIGRPPSRRQYLSSGGKYSQHQVEQVFGSWTKFILAAGAAKVVDYIDEGSGPKVLFFDIETFPIVANVWGIWDQNVGLNQIEHDWCVASFAANWLGSDEVIYADQRKAKDIRDDKKTLEVIWKLLDEADIVVSQNGKKFDQKKLFARFIINRMKPPSSFRHIDTLVIAKKVFAFTSNKLEYMTEKMNVKYKKLKHKKFPGFELWSECLKGNPEAWEEMETYNKHDVLALKELWGHLRAWDMGVNFNLYHGKRTSQCNCGGSYQRHGFYYTNAGKFQRYRCGECGSEARGRENLLSRGKKDSLRLGTVR